MNNNETYFIDNIGTIYIYTKGEFSESSFTA